MDKIGVETTLTVPFMTEEHDPYSSYQVIWVCPKQNDLYTNNTPKTGQRT